MLFLLIVISFHYKNFVKSHIQCSDSFLYFLFVAKYRENVEYIESSERPKHPKMRFGRNRSFGHIHRSFGRISRVKITRKMANFHQKPLAKVGLLMGNRFVVYLVTVFNI